MSNVALLGYALASIAYLVAFQRSRSEAITKASFALFALSTAAVSGALAATVQTATLVELSGLLLTAAVGWLTVGGHLSLKMRTVGAFVAPLATLILLIKFFVGEPGPAAAETEAARPLVQLHVAFAVLGQAFAILACGVSLVYIWQQNLLKKRLLDQLGRDAPAIDRLAKVLMGSLWTGFVLITLGLVSGALYVQIAVTPPELSLPAKIAWAVVVWLWYLATLLARYVLGRPMRRIALMSLLGFALLALTYFGMGVFRTVGG